MNTYPQEYVLHSVPVLAVYGLNDQPTNPPTPRQPPSSRASLGTTLATILSSKQQYTIYESTRYLAHNSPGSPPFRVLFVDKDFTLPERVPAGPNLPLPHTDLSPLSKGSPLYPDGFMTPLWVKRHMETPSAIVGFYDLWDWSMEPGSPPRPKRETGPLASHVLIDPTEREKDALLAQEINTHRKYYQEKGIKFAVTIILKRQHTDDSAVEERLSMIRKQAGLDSKGSMFTIAPGTQHDMQEFVNGLYRALYEPAIQYYNARIKNLRKKKSKLPSPASTARLLPSDSNEPQPLSIQGWMMRYEYKIAFFLETRQDIEGATKSYESAYKLLSDMLAPKSSITPGQTGFPLRGKRWEEARELVDCINIKICRFYLYMNDPPSALAQLNTHLQTIQTYSNVWGIGEQSFEYWAWLSKQYRIFADLIDTATQHGFKIPVPTMYMSAAPGSPHLPGSPLLGGGGSSGNMGIADTDLGGCNPAAVLQHPGFYYHLAAMCCAERRRRFLEMDASKATGAMQTLLANEKQIDHSNQTIELLTKSYEQFKKNRSGRMTLYLAAEIAGTYYETGKYEMALKFFERIGKTYRKEKWNMVLTSILRWSLRCAKELKTWDRAFEFLLELLSSELPMPDQKRQDIQKELLDLMQTNDEAEATSVPIAINVDEINPPLTCSVQFKTREDYVNSPVHFQISLKTGKTSPPIPLRFTSMRILFSESQYNIVLFDNGSEEYIDRSVELINCYDDVEKLTDGEFGGWTTKKVDLRVAKNQTRVFEGCIAPKDCGELKIIGLCLDLKSSYRHVSLNYDLNRPAEDFSVSRRKWLLASEDTSKPIFTLLDGRGELNKIKISQRPPRVHMKVEHEGQALLDELYKVNVTLENEEQVAIEGLIYAEMKDSEGQEQVASFSVDSLNEHQVSLGRIEPGQSCTKSLYLRGSDIPGIRTVTLLASYNAADNESKDNMIEKRETLRISFRAPFESGFRLTPQVDGLPPSDGDPELSRSEKWLVTCSIRNCADTDLEIEKIEFEQQPFEHPLTNLSLISEPGPLKSSEWKHGNVHNANYLFRLKTEDVTEPQPAVPAGNINIYWKRSDGGQQAHYFKTKIALPSLEFRPPSLSIIAEAPHEIYVGEPFTLTYTINNPTVHLAEFHASVELSDAFVFSGLKMLRGRILPLGRATYYYTCYPLIAGKVRLPRLKVIAKQLGVEKEIPIEMLDGLLKQGGGGDVTEQRPPLMVFANARRMF